jgi:hypothetical protein
VFLKFRIKICFSTISVVRSTILPPTDDYSSWDKGGHLDRRGGIAFTRDIVTALERTQAFRSVIDDP